MCVCASQLWMGLRTEQMGYSFKVHVRRKINQQQIEQQTQQDRVKINVLRLIFFYEHHWKLSNYFPV